VAECKRLNGELLFPCAELLARPSVSDSQNTPGTA
jgi:hypothetical protein